MKEKFCEVEDKLVELNKVVQAMEQAIKIIDRSQSNLSYMSVPKEIIRKEINTLNSKIEHLKNNAIVTYDSDVEFINKLVETV